MTMLLPSARPEDLGDVADLIAVIADGRVAAAAPPQELLSEGGDAEIGRYLGR